MLTQPKSSLNSVFLRAFLSVFAGLGAVACADAPEDTAIPDVAPVVEDSVADSVEFTTLRSTYDPSLGDILLLPVVGDAVGGELTTLLSPLIAPDAIPSDTLGLRERVGEGRVQLFSRAGLLGEGTVRLDPSLASGTVAECATWPLARVQPAADLRAGRWLVALPYGRVNAIALDSIESLPARDSAVLAAGLTRAASSIAEDSTSAFRGLPFTVLRGYRVLGGGEVTAASLADTGGFAVGVLVRRIPQEDRPLEERVLIVVSTPDADPRRWSVVWFERVSGREEEVIATEPLAAFRVVGRSRISLVLGRDDGHSTSLALLERVGARWRVRWESALTGC